MTTFRETPEIPDINPRRKALIKAFNTGSPLDLMNVLYELAEDDYNASLPGYRSQKRTARASMGVMLDDRDSGQRDMLALLLTIPRPIVESIIWNTIGAKYTSDLEFRKLFYKKDATAGVYLNTALREVHGKPQGFRHFDWVGIRDIIKRYMDGEGVVIDARSTDHQREAATMASKIDGAFGTRNSAGNQYRASLGHRHWLSSRDAREKTRIFSDKIKECRLGRDRMGLGFTPQLQAPVEVGLAHYDLSTRMDDHLPKSGLHRTVKPWGLVLSIVELGSFSPVVVSVPILKIWDPDLLMKGEILITLLGGAAVEDGGFNPTQAGVSGSRAPADSYQKELEEVFQDNDWLDENLEAAEAEAQSRRSALQACSDFDSGGLGQLVADLTRDVRDMKLARAGLDGTIQQKAKEEQREVERLRTHLRSLADLTIRVNRNLAFQGSLDSWLGSQDDET